MEAERPLFHAPKEAAHYANKNASQDEDHHHSEQVRQGMENSLDHLLEKLHQEAAQPLSPGLGVREAHQLVHQPNISQEHQGNQGEEPDNDTLEGDDLRAQIHAADLQSPAFVDKSLELK